MRVIPRMPKRAIKMHAGGPNGISITMMSSPRIMYLIIILKSTQSTYCLSTYIFIGLNYSHFLNQIMLLCLAILMMLLLLTKIVFIIQFTTHTGPNSFLCIHYMNLFHLHWSTMLLAPWRSTWKYKRSPM